MRPAREETHMAESRRSLSGAPSHSLSTVTGSVPHPATVCDNTHRTLLTRETSLGLWCPEFLLGLNHIPPTWLTFGLQSLWDVGLMALVPFPPEVGTDTDCSRGSITNHTLRLSSSQSRRQTQTLPADRHSRSPLSSPEQRPDLSLGKVSSSLCNVAHYKVRTQRRSAV